MPFASPFRFFPLLALAAGFLLAVSPARAQDFNSSVTLGHPWTCQCGLHPNPASTAATVNAAPASGSGFSASGAGSGAAGASGPFNIVINANTSLASNTAALAAFERAAVQWESRITDAITVTINAGLASLGSNILGSTSAVVLLDTYSSLRDAMIADSAGQADETIVASLPTESNFRAALPTGIALSGDVSATKANFKALGYTGLDAVFGDSDGAITFSTNFAFDYDNRDGVGAGLTDFETVAAHEIGHLLGFISEVDYVDFLVARGSVGDVDPTTLDLFRFQNNAANDPSSAAQFATAERYLLTGGDAITDDIISEYRMSTGVSTGDGNQASHWKTDDIAGNPTIGIMDPTLARQQVTPVGEADLRAMDLIGYDVVTGSALVPEPTSVALLLPVALIGYSARTRRRTRVAR